MTITELRKRAKQIGADLRFTRTYTVNGAKIGPENGGIILTAPEGKQWKMTGSSAYEGVYTRSDPASRADAADLVAVVIEGGYKDSPAAALPKKATSQDVDLPAPLRQREDRRATALGMIDGVESAIRQLGKEALDDQRLTSLERMERAASLFQSAAILARATVIIETI